MGTSEACKAAETNVCTVGHAPALAEGLKCVGTYEFEFLNPPSEEAGQRIRAYVDNTPGFAEEHGDQQNLRAAEILGIELVRTTSKLKNTVVTAGKTVLLDNFLAASAYTATGPFLGLISSTSWTPLATTISSGTYTTGTGAVTLTTGAAHGLGVGDVFTLDTVTGTGSMGALNGSFTAVAGTTGSTLNFTTVLNLTMTISGGNVTASGIRVADTMGSHAKWLEAGNANAPTYTAPRQTMPWAAASGNSKAVSSPRAFAILTSGTVKGAFVVLHTGAVTTIDSTAGTLFSAGLFTGGDQQVSSGATVNVSWSLAL